MIKWLGNCFKTREDLEEYKKRNEIEHFKKAVKLFNWTPDMAHSVYVDECAKRLNELCGLGYDEIEQIEIGVYESLNA